MTAVPRRDLRVERLYLTFFAKSSYVCSHTKQNTLFPYLFPKMGFTRKIQEVALVI